MKMDGYYPLKMKRKDLEQVSDEFSDFSLSAPARKIRRLVILNSIIVVSVYLYFLVW